MIPRSYRLDSALVRPVPRTAISDAKPHIFGETRVSRVSSGQVSIQNEKDVEAAAHKCAI